MDRSTRAVPVTDEVPFVAKGDASLQGHVHKVQDKVPAYHRWERAIGIHDDYYRTRAEYADEQLREMKIAVKYIVGQSMYPWKPATLVKSPNRRWEIVDTLDEARELLSYWPEAEVYRLEGANVEPLKIDSAVHHHALCDFSWYEGKRLCTCEDICPAE